MPRPKRFKDAEHLCVVMSKAQADRIRFMCLRMTSQEQRPISVSEAIRMAIEAAYPIPKAQPDLFK